MVKKRTIPQQETEYADEDENEINESIEEVTESPKRTKGFRFSVDNKATKIQDRECYFCNDTERPLFAIVRISNVGVDGIVSVCAKDLRRVFKTESNGNLTFKMKEAYNY